MSAVVCLLWRSWCFSIGQWKLCVTSTTAWAGQIIVVFPTLLAAHWRVLTVWESPMLCVPLTWLHCTYAVQATWDHITEKRLPHSWVWGTLQSSLKGQRFRTCSFCQRLYVQQALHLTSQYCITHFQNGAFPLPLAGFLRPGETAASLGLRNLPACDWKALSVTSRRSGEALQQVGQHPCWVKSVGAEVTDKEGPLFALFVWMLVSLGFTLTFRGAFADDWYPAGILQKQDNSCRSWDMIWRPDWQFLFQ